MATFVDQHSGTIESLSSLKMTFVNTGGGKASTLPVKYIAATERMTTAKALGDLLGDNCAYKPQSIVSHVAIDTTTDIPVDPGAEPRDVTFHFRVKITGQPAHSEKLWVPGVLAATADAMQTLGEAIATLLSGSGVVFEFIRITNSK
jgi:hypothetical protein